MNRITSLIVLLGGVISILTSACFPYGFISAGANSRWNDYIKSNAAPPEMDRQAKKTAAVPSDKALVYLYRYGPYRPYAESLDRLYIDNKCAAGSLWPPSFYLWLLSPGVHTFEVSGSKLVFNAIGGETYYILQKGSFFSFDLSMELVDKETGRKDIESSRLLNVNIATACGLPRNPSAADTEMKNLVAPRDRALIYLYRGRDKYEYQDAEIYLDEKDAIKIVSGTGLVWQPKPGAHNVTSGEGKITLDAKAGTIYFIRLDVKHHWVGRWFYSLHWVNSEEGHAGVNDSLLLIQAPEE